jgi:crotonobetainyl-CoA:carnitine CoA-transferase CaiB-like acyl-CoA transferase
LPLKGTRVLDLTRVLAGPLSTMQLGDLGADVIKIERPGAGDESRGWGPPWDDRGESAYYLCCNRNKFSVAADLALPADAEMVRALIREADVVVDNFLPGALARRGLDPDAIVAEQPRLVWCTISGFRSEPDRPGYDYVVQAESGWMSVTGVPEGEPMKVGVALADILTGKETVAAILAALAGVRAGVPVERRVRVSLYETAVSALMNVAQNVLVSGGDARRWGNAHPNLVPYEMFDAADGAVVIAVGNEAQYAALANVLGGGALQDARFATNAGRVAHREAVVRLVRERIATKSAAEWMAAFRAVGVPAGVVRTVADALHVVGASAATGINPQFPGQVRRPPPTLDQHGDLVRAHGWAAFERA